MEAQLDFTREYELTFLLSFALSFFFILQVLEPYCVNCILWWFVAQVQGIVHNS